VGAEAKADDEDQHDLRGKVGAGERGHIRYQIAVGQTELVPQARGLMTYSLPAHAGRDRAGCGYGRREQPRGLGQGMVAPFLPLAAARASRRRLHLQAGGGRSFVSLPERREARSRRGDKNCEWEARTGAEKLHHVGETERCLHAPR
jgi:hypothetical protein